MPNRPIRHGFTLIELLVVIAIIAILAAILFPVFAKAREKARSSSCQANLKQLSTAFGMYWDDYDRMAVSCAFGYTTGTMPARTGARADWADHIFPYVKNEQVYVCPSAPSVVPNAGYGCDGGYSINWRYWSNFQYVQWMDGIKSPAETIVALDGDYYYCSGGVGGQADGWKTHPTPRHNEMCNIFWFDGHVKALRYEQFADDTRNASVPSGWVAGTNPNGNPNKTSFWDMD